MDKNEAMFHRMADETLHIAHTKAKLDGADVMTMIDALSLIMSRQFGDDDLAVVAINLTQAAFSDDHSDLDMILEELMEKLYRMGSVKKYRPDDPCSTDVLYQYEV